MSNGKIIRFPLEMEDGANVRTLEDLQKHFSLDRVLLYLEDGKLDKWLRNNYLNDIADEISLLDRKSDDFNQKLCEAFDVEYNVTSEEELEKAKELTRKREKLKEYTSDKKFFDVLELIAFDQDDVYNLLDEGKSTIYLCGDKFSIPFSQDCIQYIGINNPNVTISATSKQLTNVKVRNISFENVKLDEKSQAILTPCVDTTVPEEVSNSLKNLAQTKISCKNNDLSAEDHGELRRVYIEMSEFIDAFIEKANNIENDDIFDNDEMDFEELDSSDYGSGLYDYERKSEAKAECKKQIKQLIADYCESAKNEKENITCGSDEYVRLFIKLDLSEFVKQFYQSLLDYIDLYCNNKAQEYIKPKIENSLVQNRLISLFSDMKLIDEFESAIAKDIDKTISDMSSASSINKYWESCTYDDDDDGYCFDMDAVAEDIYSEFDNVLENAKDKRYQIFTEIFCNGVIKFCKGLKAKTAELCLCVEMFTDNSNDIFDNISAVDLFKGTQTPENENSLNRINSGVFSAISAFMGVTETDTFNKIDKLPSKKKHNEAGATPIKEIQTEEKEKSVNKGRPVDKKELMCINSEYLTEDGRVYVDVNDLPTVSFGGYDKNDVKCKVDVILNKINSELGYEEYNTNAYEPACLTTVSFGGFDKRKVLELFTELETTLENIIESKKKNVSQEIVTAAVDKILGRAQPCPRSKRK